MKKQDFINLLKQKVLILDGATGTELQKFGFLEGVSTPEELNIKFPERIKKIYSSYIDAGSDIIFSNTFGANYIKLAQYKLDTKIEEIIKAGVSIAKQEALRTGAFVAGDISSVGSYIQPLGTVSFDQAYNAFKQQTEILRDSGVDLIVIETMTEIKELKAAVLAARDVYDGPIMVQMSFTEEGTTVTGTDILSFIAMAESLDVTALGMNCSVGPLQLLKFAKILSENTNLPISFKPNAGMPQFINRKTVYPGTLEEFVNISLQAYQYGINMFGGCCGTTPEYIKLLSENLKNKKPVERKFITHHLLSSRTKAIDLNLIPKPVKIGERINPTGRKKFQEELSKNIFGMVKAEARIQTKNGADILDVNMGLPGGDEVNLITNAVNEIQEIVNVPLSIDSSSHKAIEVACKHCAGKPLINSVNGEDEKLNLILPIVKRYGASVIALTVDEKGIPKTAEERLKISEKILKFADKYNINKNEIIFDYLTLSASSSPEQAQETLKAVKMSKKIYPDNKVVLGVSNISFGLPSRQMLNSTFLKMAIECGLDIAICNPSVDWTIDDEYARNLLNNKDTNAKEYIKKHSCIQSSIVPSLRGDLSPKQSSSSVISTSSSVISTEGRNLSVSKNQNSSSFQSSNLPIIQSSKDNLFNSILNGDKDYIVDFIDKLLKQNITPLQISNDLILKALNIVGEKFNSKEYFLPQVIMSAEAAQKAFAYLKPKLKKEKNSVAGKVVMATVKGDVHDIGKNIVCAVLESFGFEVFDLGKNVDDQTIIDKAIEYKADIIGLSALMTTTMTEMEKVIKLKEKMNLKVKIIVGGAPVTKKFADSIKADAYAQDAISCAKQCSLLLS